MGQIIYERNMGWVVWKLTNTKSGLKVAWGFNFLGKRLFLSVNMFYRIWDKPAGSKKTQTEINFTTTMTSLKRLKTETKILIVKPRLSSIIISNFGMRKGVLCLGLGVSWLLFGIFSTGSVPNLGLFRHCLWMKCRREQGNLSKEILKKIWS